MNFPKYQIIVFFWIFFSAEILGLTYVHVEFSLSLVVTKYFPSIMFHHPFDLPKTESTKHPDIIRINSSREQDKLGKAENPRTYGGRAAWRVTNNKNKRYWTDLWSPHDFFKIRPLKSSNSANFPATWAWRNDNSDWSRFELGHSFFCRKIQSSQHEQESRPNWLHIRYFSGYPSDHFLSHYRSKIDRTNGIVYGAAPPLANEQER